MTISAITGNLGCGGPDRDQYLAKADDWLNAMQTGVDLLFLQEIPSREWLSGFDSERFSAYTAGADAPSYRCISAVVVATTLKSALLPIPERAYHGSYLAGATVELGRAGSVACVSVHASPSRLRDEDERKWAAAPPRARTGGGADAGRLWDADYVLESLAQVQRSAPVLAAGDFNESRRWDTSHPGETWGEEFFRAVKSFGFVDRLNELWRCEQPTHGDDQLDHVLATPSVASLVTQAEVMDDTPSDHRLVHFLIDPDRQ
jgi:endonuclease/exonuclease/phosphatase family metal-dependent hydrolase